MDFQSIIAYLTSNNLDVLLPLSFVAFLIILPLGSDVWQKIFTVGFLIKGLTLLLFPQFAADMVILKSDALHLQEIRCVGIIMISEACVHILLRKSADPTVRSCLLWTRTVFFAVMAMLVYFTVWTAKDKENNNLKLKLYGNATAVSLLIVGGFLYYSLTQKDWGGYAEPVTTHRDFHIRLDFIIWFLHGILTLIFPNVACKFQTTLPDLDTAHQFLARSMGAGFLCLALMSGRCVNFLREEEKKSVLISHGCASLLFLLTMAFCQLFTKVFSEWHLYYGMSFVALTAMNAFLGCDLPLMIKSAKIQLRKLVTKTKD